MSPLTTWKLLFYLMMVKMTLSSELDLSWYGVTVTAYWAVYLNPKK